MAFRVLQDYVPDDRTVPAHILNAMANAKKLWVAVSDNKPVSFVGCRDMGTLLYVHEISVAHNFQKQGIGRKLMQTVIENATGGGYLAIGLTTRRDARWNMPFYASLGFAEITDTGTWPDLFAQLQKEIADGANPTTRCAMIKVIQ